MKNKKISIHIVSHTHWDREWIVPFENYRIRLIKVIDHLLSLLENNKDFKCFHLDGQTVMLEDYLEIRPENRERLKKFIKSGKILIGPWYLLMDEFLVSGESIIRNLLLGEKVGKEFGRLMKVGYLPDMFGHISQMPQILKGFGLNSAIIWRGTPHNLPNELIWEGLDASRVFTVKLSDEGGYMYGHCLPNDKAGAIEHIEKIVALLAPFSTTNHILLMNGVDQAGVQSSIPKIIRTFNQSQKKIRLVHSSLPEYIKKVKAKVRQPTVITAEQRTPNRDFTWKFLYSETASSRLGLKLDNYLCQEELEKQAEPLSAMASLVNANFPKKLLEQSWKYLLKNQAHDSICGCSHEDVHSEMKSRFKKSLQISGEISQTSLKAISKNINTFNLIKKDEKALVLFNTLNFERKGCYPVNIELPKEENIKVFSLFSAKGKPIPYQIIGKETRAIMDLDEIQPKPPERHIVDRWNIVLKLNSIPSLGYTVIKISPHSIPNRCSSDLKSGQNWAENKFIKIKLNRDGTFNLTDKVKGNTYSNLGIFLDEGDAGNEYRFIKPEYDHIVASKGRTADISLWEDGPLQITFKVNISLPIPRSLDLNNKKRSKKKSVCQITTYIILKDGCKWLEIKTYILNKAIQHRIRTIFPSKIQSKRYAVETQFGVVERDIALPDDKGWKEKFSIFGPQHGWVDISDKESGLTIMNKGLMEGGIEDNKERNVSITLLRSIISWLCRGISDTVSGSMCLGAYTTNYAVMSHDSNWERSNIVYKTQDFQVPLKSLVISKQYGILPSSLSFLSIDNPHIRLSALKQSEDGKGIILRMVNYSRQASRVRVTFWKEFKRVYFVNLNESIIKRIINKSSKQIEAKLGRFKILTMKIIF